MDIGKEFRKALRSTREKAITHQYLRSCYLSFSTESKRKKLFICQSKNEMNYVAHYLYYYLLFTFSYFLTAYFDPLVYYLTLPYRCSVSATTLETTIRHPFLSIAFLAQSLMPIQAYLVTLSTQLVLFLPRPLVPCLLLVTILELLQICIDNFSNMLHR